MRGQSLLDWSCGAHARGCDCLDRRRLTCCQHVPPCYIVATDARPITPGLELWRSRQRLRLPRPTPPDVLPARAPLLHRRDGCAANHSWTGAVALTPEAATASTDAA